MPQALCTFRSEDMQQKVPPLSHLPLAPIQTALLFEAPDHATSIATRWDWVIAQLNTRLGALAGHFHPINVTPGSHFALIGNAQNTLHTTVELMPEPLGLDGFGDVLNNTLYRSYHTDRIEAVTAHKAAILVGVGLGEVPFPADHPVIAQLGMTDEITGGQDQAKYELRLRIAQTLGAILCESQMPTIVHWTQSQQLLPGAAFVSLANADFSLPLYVDCNVFGTGEMEGGSQKVGINGSGSQFLLGAHVYFEEDPQPFMNSYKTVLGFVAYCRQIGRVLRDDETFDGPNGETICVRHTRTSDGLGPAISLCRKDRLSVTPVPPAPLAATNLSVDPKPPAPAPETPGVEAFAGQFGLSTHTQPAPASSASTITPATASAPCDLPPGALKPVAPVQTTVLAQFAPMEWMRDYVLDGGAKTRTLKGQVARVGFAVTAIAVMMLVSGAF